jgi:hypothetical protein
MFFRFAIWLFLKPLFCFGNLHHLFYWLILHCSCSYNSKFMIHCCFSFIYFFNFFFVWWWIKFGEIGVVWLDLYFLIHPFLNFNLIELFLPKCYLVLWNFIWLLAGGVKYFLFFFNICPITLLLMVNNLIWLVVSWNCYC